MANDALTPMMKQFYDLKAKNPDAILLFRCGDFYETYADDAVEAAQVLGITLTRSTPICPASYVPATAWPSATNWKTPN